MSYGSYVHTQAIDEFIPTRKVTLSLSHSMYNRSEGFSRTGYLVPARGTPGVSPDGESCWDAAVAAAAVIWKFRSTFWLGNYIWSLSRWNWTQMGDLGTSVPGFCIEFRYLSYGHSGFAWGAILGKSQNIWKMQFSKKWK